MTKKFTIDVEMQERWIPHFLGMLRQMEHLGIIGSSNNVALYSDGDGDFRPKFKWNNELPAASFPIHESEIGYLFDAG